jgi:diadenosine tetraphosphate (Ap4A) HIT family hydrolase
MSWQDYQKWEQMIDGTNCPMCQDIHMPENRHSFLVKELAQSYVRLPKNQDPYGLVLVALKRHATELYELESQERDEFFKEVAKVSKAVKELFKPVKLYYGIFGARCPHFHCHIIPHYISDDPYAPLALNQKKVDLKAEEYTEILRNLRALLAD